MRRWSQPFSLLILFSLCPAAAHAAESSQHDPAVPYRTDSTNEHLPRYRFQPGVFPPKGSEHRVRGELVEADFIHRAGQFRTSATGELVNFSLPSFGTVQYLGTEADLRDVPLGTRFQFFLYQDDEGAFTQAARMEDEFSQLAGEGFSYRLDKTQQGGGKLEVVKQNVARKQSDLGRSELLVNKTTRVWRDDKQISLTDLAVGDALLVNLTAGPSEQESLCTEIWVGVESQKLATEHERALHKAFLESRGLAARIDSVEGKQVTVTLLGDPISQQALFKDEGIDAAQWAKEHRNIRCVVANDELRTYNPPVDGQGSMVAEFRRVPTDSWGASGVSWVIEPSLLLEGFRKGRIVRLFAQQSWPVNDMPFGESIYSEAPGVMAGLEEPLHFPYRTDLVNEELPWYRLQIAKFPPLRSEHVISGELLKSDPQHRTGQFRVDRSEKLVDFTMPAFGSITYVNAPAQLGDLPLGTRYHFHLYQDDHGAFTRAVAITDEFIRLLERKLSYRVEALKLGEGELLLASQQAMIHNDKDALVRPPDVARGEFVVEETTRVWKEGKRIKLSDLAIGDELLINETGRTLKSRGRCTEIWVGEKTFERTTALQREKNHDLVKQRGFAGWINRIAGKDLTVAFFNGPGEEYNTLFHDGPVGGKLKVVLVDESLIPVDPAGMEMNFKSSDYGDVHTGTYGYRGTSWGVESDKLSKACSVGQAILVFDPNWSKK